MKIRYFENEKMSAWETATLAALADLNDSMTNGIAEGFPEHLDKPKNIYNILLNAYKEMVIEDMKDEIT